MSPTTFGLSPLLTSAAQHQGAPVTGDQRVFYAGARDLSRLTDNDRELIEVVTGELLPPVVTGVMRRVSFFTLQLALDRVSGPLMDGRDATIEYFEDVYSAYEATCPTAGSPFSGELLDLTLAFLVGRELARQDREFLAA